MKVPDWLYWDRRACGWYLIGIGAGFGMGFWIGVLVK